MSRRVFQTISVAVIGAGLLIACSPAAKPPAAPKPAVLTPVDAPAGRYEIDPFHSSLIFRWRHIGLGDYVARFTRVSSVVTLDPEHPERSSVIAQIDPASISADFPGDFRQMSPGTPYKSWNQELAESPEMLNAKAFKTISFRSTRIERTGDRTARITGDLTLLGQTRPVTLDATLTGSTRAYPMVGGAAIGIKAVGHFKRSDFGLKQWLDPEFIGNDISFEFNADFKQAAAQPASS